jgi:thioredoxin-like negative regulator of GroEL
MIPLLSQQQFEEEIWNSSKTQQKYVVYFTADWCKACKRLNLPAIQTAAAQALTIMYKCDVDVNDYTGSYCGIKTIPTFICFKGKKVIGQISNSETGLVTEWLQRMAGL